MTGPWHTVRAGRALLPAAVAALLVSPLAGQARAEPDAVGVLCGWTSLQMPTEEWQLGELDAGPLVLNDPDDPAAVVFGSVTCTLQAEPAHGTAANDLASLTGSTTPGVASVAGTVAYQVDPDDTIWLCTRVDIAGGPTLYWDDPGGAWSTSSDVSCVGPGIGPDPEPLPDIDYEFIDCPILALLFPPEGDIPGVWDCPPYGV